MVKNPIFSIIIPVRLSTTYLRQTLLKLKKQTFKSYEVLVITDKISKIPHPSFKRNYGAKIAKGKYLAFLDDDSYPDKNWLNNALVVFTNNPNSSAVCGPCLTPLEDSVYQQASGLVWSSYLGSGGAGTYRNTIQKERLVDDFPSVNLIVNKADFVKLGGFNLKYWPGEDTLLCSDLVNKLKKTIVYHPSIKVFHHRRKIIIPHLKQISRYAIHRGYFARVFPKTSFRLGYLMPSLFTLYCIFLIPLKLTIFPLYIYISLLILSFFQFIAHHRLLVSFLAMITIPITHLYYGCLFLYGFFNPNLKSSLHQVDKKSNQYVGG